MEEAAGGAPNPNPNSNPNAGRARMGQPPAQPPPKGRELFRGQRKESEVGTGTQNGAGSVEELRVRGGSAVLWVCAPIPQARGWQSEGVLVRGGGFPEQSPGSQHWLSQLCPPPTPHPNAPQRPWVLPAPQHPGSNGTTAPGGVLTPSLR